MREWRVYDQDSIPQLTDRLGMWVGYSPPASLLLQSKDRGAAFCVCECVFYVLWSKCICVSRLSSTKVFKNRRVVMFFLRKIPKFQIQKSSSSLSKRNAFHLDKWWLYLTADESYHPLRSWISMFDPLGSSSKWMISWQITDSHLVPDLRLFEGVNFRLESTKKV